MNKLELDKNHLELKKEIFPSKLNESIEILEYLGINTTKKIEWLINNTKEQVKQYLQFQTTPKYTPNPETLSYKIANDFLKEFHNSDIKSFYEKKHNETNPHKNAIEYIIKNYITTDNNKPTLN